MEDYLDLRALALGLDAKPGVRLRLTPGLTLSKCMSLWYPGIPITWKVVSVFLLSLLVWKRSLVCNSN